MRPTHYLAKVIRTGEVTRVQFLADHYKEAGVSYSPLAGFPELEAYQLLNRWNTRQDAQSVVYGLEY